MHSPTITATKWWPGDREYPSVAQPPLSPRRTKLNSRILLTLRPNRSQMDFLLWASDLGQVSLPL